MSEQETASAGVVGHYRDANYLDVYANQVGVSTTFTDITLIFGVVDSNASGDFITTDKVSIRLAPATCKLLFANLKAVLGAWEAALGPLPLRTSMTRSLNEMQEMLTKSLSTELESDP